MKPWLAGLALFALSSFAIAETDSGAAREFYLQDGETVVFFGDSITQAGTYVEYVDAYLRTLFPERVFHLFNRGISSETISGTSETDHDPPRPDAHRRFTRDVASLKPDVIVSCFGMNDGNYFPFEPTRFEKFKDGVRRLIQRVREETGARLVIMTPPPYDAYRRVVSDPDAAEYGYKFPAVDYDQTLERYSQWIMEIDAPGVMPVDLHARMNEHLRRRRRTRVSFSMQPDGVHPDATGHGLMAWTLLEAWGAPARGVELIIDARELEVLAGKAIDLKREGDGLALRWKTPPPPPMDSRWDAASIALDPFFDRMGRSRLQALHLTAPAYRIVVDGDPIATFGGEDLAAGIDLNALGEWPAVKASRETLELIQERRQLLYKAWRASIADEKEMVPAAVARARELDARLRDLCAPREYALEFKSFDEPPSVDPIRRPEKP